MIGGIIAAEDITLFSEEISAFLSINKINLEYTQATDTNFSLIW